MPHPMQGFAEATVNRALRMDPELENVLAPLVGKRLSLKIEPDSNLHFMLVFYSDGIVLMDPETQVSDTQLRGTLSAMLGLLPGSPLGMSGAGINVSGDSTVLVELKRALSRLRIDWRGLVAQIFGDTAGHSMAQGLELLADAFSRTAHSLWLDTAEYLGEESTLAENRTSISDFCAGVEQLCGDTARLEARLQRLESCRVMHSVGGDSP